MRPHNWIKLHSEHRNYVLGDAPAFSIDRGGRSMSCVGSGDRLAIFLPISPECCLMGYFDTEPPKIPEKAIIGHAIAVSKEAFFFDRIDNSLSQVGYDLIGSEAKLLEQTDLEHIAKNAWSSQ